MSQGLPLRKDIPKQEKWDLSDLFESDEAFYQTLEEVLSDTLAFNKTFENHLDSVEQVKAALPRFVDLLVQIDRLGNYAEMYHSVDTTDPNRQN